MFGGESRQFQVIGDPWRFDGSNWHPVSTVGAAPSTRLFHQMASLNGRVSLFGGFGGEVGFAQGDTWSFDGIAWIHLTDAGPGPRGGMTMATLDNEIVLFGGSVDGFADFGDTWVFDGTAWKQLDIPGPTPRYLPSMATLDHHVILFEGETTLSNLFGDTWSFDGTRWTALTPVHSPPAMAQPAMAALP